MSSGGSSSGGKAGSVIVVLAVLVVAFLAYNKICDECIFAFPEKGGGESGQSVIIAPGGAAPPPTGGFDWGALVVPFILLALLGGGIWHFGMKWADRRAGRRTPREPLPALPPGKQLPALPPGKARKVRRADLEKGKSKSIFAEYFKDANKKEAPLPPSSAPRTELDQKGTALKEKFPKVFGEWAQIVGGGVLINNFVYFNSKLPIKNHTGWKFHIYADNPTDVFSIGDKIIPALKKLSMVSKVVPTPDDISKMVGEQRGKAFTIYVYCEHPKNFKYVQKAAFGIAKKLDSLLDTPDLKVKEKYSIPGDRLIPGTKSGRIFYTYELDRQRSEFDDQFEEAYHLSYYRRSEERKKDNKHNIKGNSDLFGSDKTSKKSEYLEDYSDQFKWLEEEK